MAAVQRQTLVLTAVVGQQVASLVGHAPLTQVHDPAEQMALTWHRLPQLPQWRGLLLVSTHLPPQQLPPGHAVPSDFVFLHLPRLLRFLQGRHAFFAEAPSGCVRPRRPAVPARRVANTPRRERPANRERASPSKRRASTRASLGANVRCDVVRNLGLVHP